MKYTSKLILNGTEYEFGAGGGGGWQPGANTIYYLPLQEDLLDHSGNSYTFTPNGTVNIVSGQATVPVCYINNGSLYTDSTNYTFGSNDFTISYFVKIPEDQSGSYWGVFGFNGTQYGSMVLQYEDTGGYFGDGANNWRVSIGYPKQRDTWMYVVTTRNGDVFTSYINGTQYDTHTEGTSFSIWQSTATKLGIGMRQDVKIKNLYISEFILEDKARTATEIQNYFDQTKSLYGIN